MSTNSTTDRVWLITGCSSGFGRELVLAAIAAGDRVMATSRTPEALSDLVAAGNGRVSTIALDITDSISIEAAVEATLALYGRIDVLVNNAGNLLLGAVEEFTMEELRRQFETVFFSAAELTKAVLPYMRKAGKGTIVQMSSMGGQVTFHAFGAYHAAKFALEGFSQTLASEVAPLGIHVLIVEPGAFRTQINANKTDIPELSPYKDTAGAFRTYVNSMRGAEPGDPAKAAAAIVQAVGEQNPPLRLALGSDAVEGLRAQNGSRLAELAAWESLSNTTDFAAT